MVGQLKFHLCRKFDSLPLPVLVVSQVHHVVDTTNIPAKSGRTTGGKYSEEGSIGARERWGRGFSVGTPFLSLRLGTKMHAREGEGTLCNSIPRRLVFKFNPIMVLHSKSDIPLEDC
jgi:hypothetical protein